MLQQADPLAMMFRGIYEYGETKGHAREKLQEWDHKLETSLEILPAFETPMQTITLHEATILNDVDDRRTNAAAESFHAKMKNFRALQRGVREVPFFLYRLAKIYGEELEDRGPGSTKIAIDPLSCLSCFCPVPLAGGEMSCLSGLCPVSAPTCRLCHALSWTTAEAHLWQPDPPDRGRQSWR